MKMRPDLSIIVPVYNVEKYLRKCLDSIVLNNNSAIEVIMVDDGSTDSSKDIVDEYALKYEYMFAYHKDNGGLSDARNYGLRFATGKFVTFLDSDDYVEPDTYHSMLELANNNNVKIVDANFTWDYPNKTLLDSISGYEDIIDYILRGRVVVWNKIYKLDWLRALNIEFPKGLLYEDVCFFLKIVININDMSEEVRLCSKILVHYIQREGSISNSAVDRIVEICDIYRDVLEYAKSKGCSKDVIEAIEYKYMRNALWGYPIKKVRKIENKNQKKCVARKLWDDVWADIPNRKNNRYLNKLSLPNIYLKLINRVIFSIIWG